MNTNDIINILRQLDNQSLSSSVLPWQLQEINRAQPLPAGNTISPDRTRLLQYAKSLSVTQKEGDVDKIEYFCFIPASNNKWKVFIVDRFSRLLARLEDYEGEIKEGVGANQVLLAKAFLLKIE